MDRELLEAARQGSLESINELIKQGANVNFGMFGAAEGGHKELVDLFVKKGANNWNYWMCGAAKGGQKELVDLFVKKGATDWNWGMRCAAKGDHKELVDLFVKNGATDWNDGLYWSKTTNLKIFFIDQGADDITYFPQFYKDICVKFHLPNGVLINKLLRRYIARFKGNKLRNEKVIINDIYETTLDQVFISPPGTVVKFRNVDYKIKGHIFYLIKSRNPQFK